MDLGNEFSVETGLFRQEELHRLWNLFSNGILRQYHNKGETTMWSNIGHKIKTLAKVICWIGIVLSVIAGIAVIAGGSAVRSYGYTYNTGSTTLTGILVIVLGALGSWLGSFMMYGFGELVERVTNIDNKLSARNPE